VYHKAGNMQGKPDVKITVFSSLMSFDQFAYDSSNRTPIVKKKYFAVCMHCRRDKDGNPRVKTRDKSKIDCQDCGHALFWQGAVL